MTWIILGDSWSSTSLNTLLSTQFYPFDHSLFMHMRARYGRDVHCWAEAGQSDLHQLQRLRWGLRGCEHTPVRVLWGWTDWSRCIGFDSNSRRFLPSPHRSDNYTVNLNIIQQLMLENFQDPVLANVEFYHWGGHSPVWFNSADAPGTHTVITHDFAHSHCGAPKNSGISTYVGVARDNNWTHSVQDLWPTTPDETAQRLERLLLKHHNWRQRSPKLYPDGGHLAWKNYSKLVQLLPQ